jgi:LuxR family maltose regulon positive regulatory protein
MNHHPTTLAKLTRPNLAGILTRERLFGALDHGREKSVIWVSGSPGAGKTTLVADYLHTWAPQSIWYQVDPGDNDVATFFHYLSQAVLVTNGVAGNNYPSLPRFTPEYQRNLSAFTRRYFRELYTRLPSTFALVFDNYQDVPEQSRLHTVLRDALDEIPAGGCVIFISRREPPTSMARLRANQRMEVIDPDLLRLTRAELDALVDLRGHQLSEPARQQLYERTEGWAAGIVLLLSREDGRGDLSNLPTDMTPQIVFDYLAGEIFESLDTETRQLLMKTVWFPQFTARMADEISGGSRGEELLERLGRGNYFVTSRTAGGQTVYQFHPLLREFLLKRSEEDVSTRDRTRLGLRAATLLEAAGQIEDAVALHVLRRNWGELIRLVREHADTMLQQGRGETIEQWLEALPQSRLEGDPWMLYWFGHCRLPFAAREARRLFEQAYELFGTSEHGSLEGQYLAIAGIQYAIINDLDDMTLLDRWIDEAVKLAAGNREFPNLAVEAQLTGYTFFSMVLRQPDRPDIEKWGERTAELAASPELDKRQLTEVALILAAATTWTGRFQHASAALQSLRHLAESPAVPMVVRATMHNVEAMYSMLIGDVESCMDATKAGMTLAESTGIRAWRNRTLIFGIGGALMIGDLSTAESLADEIDAGELARGRFDTCLLHYFTAWKAMLENDVMRAYQELRAGLSVAKEMGLPFFELLCSLALAQILFASGDSVKGRRYLRRVRSMAVRIKNRWLEFTSLLAFAQIANMQGRRRTALNSLRYALSVGRERGYMHSLWWQPQEIAKLCVVALEEGIEVDYVRTLIEHRNLVPEVSPLHLDSWPWRFRVLTLGHFEIRVAGQKGLLAARGRPIELLKTVIALGGRSVSVDRITDAIWPNIDRDYAYRSFNTTLHRLRKLLGVDEAVIMSDNQLTLNDRYFWVDVWAFEQCLENWRCLMRDSSLCRDDIIALADRAIRLYQGGFMPADEDRFWAVSPREQLRNQFIRFVSDAGHCLEELQCYEDAVELYQRGLEVDAVAECIYRRLMLCFNEIGRAAEAIDTYARCSKSLSSQLSVGPSTETTSIYEALTNGGH